MNHFRPGAGGVGEVSAQPDVNEINDVLLDEAQTSQCILTVQFVAAPPTFLHSHTFITQYYFGLLHFFVCSNGQEF